MGSGPTAHLRQRNRSLCIDPIDGRISHRRRAQLLWYRYVWIDRTFDGSGRSPPCVLADASFCVPQVHLLLSNNHFRAERNESLPAPQHVIASGTTKQFPPKRICQLKWSLFECRVRVRGPPRWPAGRWVVRSTITKVIKLK